MQRYLKSSRATSASASPPPGEGQAMKRAIGKYWRDSVALLALFLLALGVGGYILANQQRLRFPFWWRTSRR